MVEYKTRLYHCHKLNRNVEIMEDYEVVNGVRTLVRCSCPYYTGTASGRLRCNGQNDFYFRCSYAQWPETK